MPMTDPVRLTLLDQLTLQDNLPGVARQLHARGSLTNEARTLLVRETFDRLRRLDVAGRLPEKAVRQSQWFFETEAQALGFGWEVDCMPNQTCRPNEGRKTPSFAYGARLQAPQVLTVLARWGAPTQPGDDCLTAWHGLIDGVPNAQKPSLSMLTLLGQLKVPTRDPVHPILHRLASRLDTPKFAHPATWMKALLKAGVEPEIQTTTGDGLWHVLARAYEQRGNLHDLDTLVRVLAPAAEDMLAANHQGETPLSLVTHPGLLAIFQAVSAPTLTTARQRRLRS